MESFSQYMCMPKLNEIKRTHDDEYKKLIKKMSNHILNMSEELRKYKQFHDEILENNAIQIEFEKYNNRIDELEKQNSELIARLEEQMEEQMEE